jgi:hypothetical protein
MNNQNSYRNYYDKRSTSIFFEESISSIFNFVNEKLDEDFSSLSSDKKNKIKKLLISAVNAIISMNKTEGSNTLSDDNSGIYRYFANIIIKSLTKMTKLYDNYNFDEIEKYYIGIIKFFDKDTPEKIPEISIPIYNEEKKLEEEIDIPNIKSYDASNNNIVKKKEKTDREISNEILYDIGEQKLWYKKDNKYYNKIDNMTEDIENYTKGCTGIGINLDNDSCKNIMSESDDIKKIFNVLEKNSEMMILNINNLSPTGVLKILTSLGFKEEIINGIKRFTPIEKYIKNNGIDINENRHVIKYLKNLIKFIDSNPGILNDMDNLKPKFEIPKFLSDKKIQLALSPNGNMSSDFKSLIGGNNLNTTEIPYKIPYVKSEMKGGANNIIKLPDNTNYYKHIWEMIKRELEYKTGNQISVDEDRKVKMLFKILEKAKKQLEIYFNKLQMDVNEDNNTYINKCNILINKIKKGEKCFMNVIGNVGTLCSINI